eukprot:TRINITY_DN4078_c0_g1_i1.p1 TRINITY_DN4078_c0_g1~~TRINITY_DN4078_c0_g1_i1.p1  ORF type:complete len:368 (-),score=69.17 TRINITY_DN4078_c0_g1_i1:828-1874(-)
MASSAVSAQALTSAPQGFKQACGQHASSFRSSNCHTAQSVNVYRKGLQVNGDRQNYKSSSLQSSFTDLTLKSALFPGRASIRLTYEAIEFDNISRRNGGALSAEMNVFFRFARIVRSYVESFVSGQEDPEKLLDQAVLEGGEDLNKLRQATAQLSASMRMTGNKYEVVESNSRQWYSRAQRALEVGDEKLAREALKRKKVFDDSASGLKRQLDQLTSAKQKLVSTSRLLESKMAEARSKKDTLKSRALSARTVVKVQEMLAGIDVSSSLAAFERVEEKVLRAEAEGDALAEVVSDNLAMSFAALDADNVDGDLEQLKREVGSAKIRGELPPFFSLDTEELAQPSYRSY